MSRGAAAGHAPGLGRPRDWLIGALLLVAVLAAVETTVGWSELLAPWRQLTPADLLSLVALTGLSYLLRAVRVYDYFRPRLDGRFCAVLRLSVLHNTANNLLPMRAGEMVFPWLLRRYFGWGFVSSTLSLVWIRILDLHFIALVGIFALHLRDPGWLWVAAALLWLAPLPFLGLLARWVPGGGGRAARALRVVAEAAPVSPVRVVRLYLWTALSWSAKLAAFAAILRHFVPLEPWRALIGVMGAELSSVLPFHGVAGSGSYELATVAALVPLGVAAEVALVGAVNLHLFLLGVTVLFGLLAFLLPVRGRGGDKEAETRDTGAT